MALPKQRHTKHRRDRARREHAIETTKTVICPKCGASVLPHRACGSCGTYRGRVVVEKTLPELSKKTKSVGKE